MESLTRRTAPGMLRVGEDRLGSGVGLKLFASVLSSKTIDGMRKLFSAPAPPLAFYIAESGIYLELRQSDVVCSLSALRNCAHLRH